MHRYRSAEVPMCRWALRPLPLRKLPFETRYRCYNSGILSNYLKLPLKEALQLKYERGLEKHRKLGQTNFVGNPFGELFEECLDAMHYCDEIHKQTGFDMSHRRSQFWATALEAQTNWRQWRKENATVCVAGIIYTSPKRDAVIIGKRTPEQWGSGKWCFPGGKIEKGETELEALHREIKEELGITVSDVQFYEIRIGDYEHEMFRINYYTCVIDPYENPTPEAFTQILRCSVVGLPYADLLPEDVDIAKRLAHEFQTKGNIV